jgi:hypothetical protein
MINSTTTITKVESTSSHVKLTVRREGSDSADDAEIVEIIPKAEGVIVRCLGLGSKVIDRANITSGDIQVNIPFTK